MTDDKGTRTDKPEERGEKDESELLVVVGFGLIPGIGLVLVTMPAKDLAELEKKASPLERWLRSWL